MNLTITKFLIIKKKYLVNEGSFKQINSALPKEDIESIIEITPNPFILDSPELKENKNHLTPLKEIRRPTNLIIPKKEYTNHDHKNPKERRQSHRFHSKFEKINNVTLHYHIKNTKKKSSESNILHV